MDREKDEGEQDWEGREEQFQPRRLRNNSSGTRGKLESFSIKDAHIKECFKERVVTYDKSC